MIRALITARLRSLLHTLTRQGRKGNRKGTLILFAFLYLYLGVALCAMMGTAFYTLAEPYHNAGLDWLYFATAGLMATGLSLFGTVFTTQSQLYDAKDNDLLLSMPIPPRIILLTRMLPLLGANLVFVSIVLVPAMVVYHIVVGFSWAGLAGQLLGLLSVTLLVQAVSCLLGWLLHLLLKRLSRSAASVVFMVVFLTVYFTVIGQANNILNSIITNAGEIARAVKSFIWPLYAMGMGAAGAAQYALAFAGITGAVFAFAYWLLSRTFLRSATSSIASGRKKTRSQQDVPARTPKNAIVHKELQKFLGTPIYLTNQGFGLLMTVGMTVAAMVFRNDLVAVLAQMGLPEGTESVMVFSAMCFLNAMLYISAPSVSLEGKNLWILKSLPLGGKEILTAKLAFHLRLVLPVVGPSGLLLSLTLGADLGDSLLCGLLSCLMGLFCGLWGMITGLKWAKFDYISEAYPCKQATFLVITMLGVMVLPVITGLLFGYFVTISPTVFLALSAAAIGGACYGLYRLMTQWGVKRWNEL